jgi:hypothetical protein
MKLYKRITRFQFRRRFPKGSYDEKKLLWGASLKPGDVIATCSGFNVRIKEIVPQVGGAKSWFGHTRRNKEGWFIDDFFVKDEDGGVHYTNSCCWKPETPEKIKKYWGEVTKEYIVDMQAKGWDSGFMQNIYDELQAGKEITDKDGILLPHLKKVRNGV